MAAQKKQINLLPKDAFEQSFLGRFLRWALSVGRYIVIGTELVVIGSFLARFSLDRQLTDLNEAIAQKQAFLASYGPFEQEVRSIQERLRLVSELEKEPLTTTATVDKVAQLTPVDVSYSLFRFSQDAIALEGIALSEAGFTTLLAGLRADTDFTNVKVLRVTSEGGASSGIEFEIELPLKRSTPTKVTIPKATPKATEEEVPLGL